MKSFDQLPKVAQFEARCTANSIINDMFKRLGSGTFRGKSLKSTAIREAPNARVVEAINQMMPAI